MMETKKQTLELYIHIPFCVHKCAYCDFLSAPAARETQEAYVECLLEEIRRSAKLSENYEVSTVFFGGGTPSILKGEQIGRILEQLKAQFSFEKSAEITLEANPGTVHRDKLRTYKDAGVNRLSFGLQSSEDTELRLLSRIHTWQQFVESYTLAREAGFENINIDLMSALPGQTKESYQKTLDRVVRLRPEHISAYSLIIEEGTPFYERYAGNPELLPSEEEERGMYVLTKEILESGGYRRYEISNYAKEGYECRHNLGYWERTDYKGYGLGAASLLHDIRFTNHTDLSEYLSGNFAGSEEKLTSRAIREEYFFLGLRKTEGVDPGMYRRYYEKLIKKLKTQELLGEKNGKIYLTERGIDVSNYVLAQFLD